MNIQNLRDKEKRRYPQGRTLFQGTWNQVSVHRSQRKGHEQRRAEFCPAGGRWN